MGSTSLHEPPAAAEAGTVLSTRTWWGLCLLICSILLLTAYTIPQRILGDSEEYFLMLEAFSDHGTPDIRPAQLERLSALYRGHLYEEVWLPRFQVRLQQMQAGVPGHKGLFRTADGDYYSYHFWAYPLFALPVKWALRWFGGDELHAFALLNALMIAGVLIYLLRWSTLPSIPRLATALLFLFCGPLYYLVWPHPEVYTATLVLLAAVAYWEQRETLGIIAALLATWQNQPVAILALLLLISSAWRHRRLRPVLPQAGISLLVFLPSLFYYTHFGVPSLIVTQHATSWEGVTLHRLWSFLFDLNQGLIVGMPAIVALCLGLIVWRIVILARRGGSVTAPPPADGLLLAALAMMLMACSTTNWNSGQSVFARYALWCGMPLIVWLIWQTDVPELSRTRTGLLAGALVIQIFCNIGFNAFHAVDLPEFHKSYVQWTFEHVPSLYNPEPEIFSERTTKVEGPLYAKDMPIPYHAPGGYMSKLLVAESMINETGVRLCGAGNRLLNLETRRPMNTAEANFSWSPWGYLSGRYICETRYPAVSPALRTLVGVPNGPALESTGKSGFLQFGPYVDLPAGRYHAEWTITLLQPFNGPVGFVDVAADGGQQITRRDIASTELALAQMRTVPLDFTLPGNARKVEYRLYVFDNVRIRLDTVLLNLGP